MLLTLEAAKTAPKVGLKAKTRKQGEKLEQYHGSPENSKDRDDASEQH